MTVERLHERAVQIAGSYNLFISPSEMEDLVPFEDHRIAIIEHVCHELSHAALLGIPFGPKLDTRISSALGTHHGVGNRNEIETFANRNEIETFAVVMLSFSVLGLPYNVEDMHQAAQVQVRWQREKILTYWATFAGTQQCLAAAKRVVASLVMQAVGDAQ